MSEIDPNALIQNPAALDEVPHPDRHAMTMATYLFVLLAGIAVVLSGSCLYCALMSFTVTERTRETGIRTALGAPRANIVLLVAKRAFLQLSAGVSIGAALSVAVLSGFRGKMESELLLRESWSVTVFIIIVLAVGIPACVKPTLRALRIAPVDATRPDY